MLWFTIVFGILVYITLGFVTNFVLTFLDEKPEEPTPETKEASEFVLLNLLCIFIWPVWACAAPFVLLREKLKKTHLTLDFFLRWERWVHSFKKRGNQDE